MVSKGIPLTNVISSHRYPLGYKPKLKSSKSKSQINQIFRVVSEQLKQGSPLGSLTTTQCQQFIALLSSQV